MEEKKSTSFLSVFLRKARLSKHSKSPVLENSVIEMSQHNHAELELKTYPQAWFALFLLVLLRTAVSVFQFTFSIIPGTTSDYYRVSLTLTNWFANIQCIIYVLMSCFTGYMFEKLGVKRSVRHLQICFEAEFNEHVCVDCSSWFFVEPRCCHSKYRCNNEPTFLCCLHDRAGYWRMRFSNGTQYHDNGKFIK